MTAQDQQSDLAQALLDEAACGLLRTSSDGTFLRVSHLFCEWVGRQREELVGHIRLQDLLSVGSRIFHQTHWVPLLQLQGSVSEVKFELIHRDGSRIPMVFNAMRRKTEDVAVYEVAAFIARDRDKYERELVHSRRRLEELVAEATRLEAEARDRASYAEQMIGIVSHDLRNPLNAISLSALLLQHGSITQEQARIVSRVQSATNRATALINDLLDFTQARLAGGLRVSIRPLELHEVVGRALEELVITHPAARLMHARLGEGPCSADDQRLAQLLGNLVSNAVAYGSKDAPVRVTSRIDEQYASVLVQNDGPVIAEETRATLFQPMTRGDNSSNTSRSVGLGLYIVREIARAHHGDVSVESSAEAGTTFSVTIPRQGR